ncbi:hypothetical protein niasHT_028316 [Heterodera trifolii]|uniref:Uncharacterized protein n=1 Tax=Heterodera trifolii TaxID=157864 RepID=A0ABD2JN18_9BILA
MPNRDNSNGQQHNQLSSASTNDNSQHFTTVHHFSPSFGLFRAGFQNGHSGTPSPQKPCHSKAVGPATKKRQLLLGRPLLCTRRALVCQGTDPVNQRQEICTVPSHEVIYDVPFDAQREEEEDEDSF